MTDVPPWEPPPAPDRFGPTPGQLQQIEDMDRTGRVGRTAVQVGVPAALVTIGTWLARLADVDLDPGPGTDMPTQVAAAFVALIGVGLAWWMNRGSR